MVEKPETMALSRDGGEGRLTRDGPQHWTPPQPVLRSICKSGRAVSIMTYVKREEFEARVGVLEREVEGEKLVTRHILEQTRRNGDDLATIRRQLDGLDLKRLVHKVDGVESKVGRLESKIGSVDAKLTSLAHGLPAMIADAMRKALSSQRRKS